MPFPAVQSRQIGEFVQAAILLAGQRLRASGVAARRPGAGGPGRGHANLNAAIVSRLRPRVSTTATVRGAKVIGSSISVGVIEALAIGQLLEDGSRDPEALIDAVLTGVMRSGRSLMRDGQPITEAAEARILVGETVRGVLAQRFQLLRDLGMIR